MPPIKEKLLMVELHLISRTLFSRAEFTTDYGVVKLKNVGGTAQNLIMTTLVVLNRVGHS